MRIGKFKHILNSISTYLVVLGKLAEVIVAGLMLHAFKSDDKAMKVHSLLPD